MRDPLNNDLDPCIINKNAIIASFQSKDTLFFQTTEGGIIKNWIRATDIAKVLNIKNIYSSVQNFGEHEKGLHEMETTGGTQKMVFLRSHGVYRLLFNSKKPEAKNFRIWACKLLDDVNFNNSQEIKKALPALENKILQEDLYNETCFYVRIQLPEKYKSALSKEKDLTFL